MSFEINTLDDVVKVRGWKDAYGIPKAIERIKARLTKGLPKGKSFYLTALQKKALNHDDFWSEKNLIIQGATSAGKTLLSEMLLLDVLQRGQKAIILVPLKAMVHERTQHFKDDIEDSSNSYQVFGSSSDYLDNDERLIAGEYSVVIMVYEKLFAMLSQPNCHILDDCKLIVVDELSMLNKDERGSKLEMALEIARVRNPESRIVCLATCDCKVNHIASWLKMDAEAKDSSQKAAVIESSLRPVALDEYIILPDGTYSFRHLKSEQEYDESDPDAYKVLDPDEKNVQGKLEVSGYRKNMKERERKKCLLLPVIHKIYGEYSNAKVLVFVASQSSTVAIANELMDKAPELFPRVSLDPEFMHKLNACDVDEEQKKLINELLPRGIAYHNASLSTTLRELIEAEFQKPESPIKVIVATETLTIGVNKPFDAMILMDNRVPRGVDELQLLTNQEYRNYIGRAGRLGQSNRPGITYLFVKDTRERNKFWNGYYQNDREIESSLADANEIKQAPYYLALLINNALDRSTKFDIKKLVDLHNASLSHISSPQMKFSAQAMVDQMVETKLMNSQKVMGKENYFLLPFGVRLAPYALSLDTCYRIFWYFFSGEINGLPVGITQEDLDEDKYLLEILYHVCRHSEIENSSTLMFPNKVDVFYGAKRVVLETLHKLMDTKNEAGMERYCLWNPEKEGDSDLYQLLHETNIPEEDMILQAAMRAILLFYWTQGKTIQEIRELTGFRPYTKIVNGDMERLAEVVSFHLDAIYRCLSGAMAKSGAFILHDACAKKAFYTLQVRVKYGMPRELTQLANKHVHGLDRSRILAFGAEAAQRGISPVSMLYIMPDHAVTGYMSVVQRNLLLEQLENRYHISKCETLINIMENDLGSGFLEEQKEGLEILFEMKGMTGEEFRDNLRTILTNKAFANFRDLNTDNLPQIIWTQTRSESEQKFSVGVLTENLLDESLDQLSKSSPSIIIFDSEETLKRYNDRGGKCQLAMDGGFFALLLANTLLLEGNGGKALAEFFKDTHGIFNAGHYENISLGNYIPWEEKKEKGTPRPRFRLLCNRNSQWMNSSAFNTTELLNALGANEDLKDFELLPWGEALTNAEDLTECPTILFLDRSQMVRSESLMVFLQRMNRQRFKNCMVLFASQDSQAKWLDTTTDTAQNELNWNMQFSQYDVHKVTAATLKEAIDGIRNFLNAWKRNSYWIGISYAHYDPERRTEVPEEQKSSWDSDTERLENLAEKLREHYGEQQILFDKFQTSRKLFGGYGSQEKSLEAYRQCDLYLILWNIWTANSEPCVKEKEVIEQRCRKGEAELIVLKSAGPYQSKVCVEGTYSKNLTEEPQELVNFIDEKLHAIQARKASADSSCSAK